MSETTDKPRVHPAAIGGAVLGAVALLLVAAGLEWAWPVGLVAVGVSAAARTPGIWTRLLGLAGIICGISAVGLAIG